MSERTESPLLLVLLYQTFVVSTSLERLPYFSWMPSPPQPSICSGRRPVQQSQWNQTSVHNLNCKGRCLCILTCTRYQRKIPCPHDPPCKLWNYPWSRTTLAIYTPPPVHRLDPQYPSTDPPYPYLGPQSNPLSQPY